MELQKIKFENKKLSEISGMKTGGNAVKCFFPEDIRQLKNALCFISSEKEKAVVLGNMTNVLIPDDGIVSPVVITTKLKKTEILSSDEEKTVVYAQAGVSLTKFSFEMCKNGLSGLEFAYGIPGTVGGAVFMNAGAYGGEVCDCISKVYAVDYDGNEKEFSVDECQFGYRNSIFQSENLVITGAEFVLVPKDPDECVGAAKEIMKKRVDKQPLEYPSCGSTFKRPEGHFAGKLIQDSGLMGFSVGGAQVSEKHAGFIVNKDGATSSDVVCLIKFVRKTVLEKYGVLLEPEIRLFDSNGDELIL